MTLAVAEMSPIIQVLLFGVAVVCFVLAAFGVQSRVGLLPAGLAAFAFVFFWGALAAT